MSVEDTPAQDARTVLLKELGLTSQQITTVPVCAGPNDTDVVDRLEASVAAAQEVLSQLATYSMQKWKPSPAQTHDTKLAREGTFERAAGVLGGGILLNRSQYDVVVAVMPDGSVRSVGCGRATDCGTQCHVKIPAASAFPQDLDGLNSVTAVTNAVAEVEPTTVLAPCRFAQNAQPVAQEAR